MSPRQPRSIHQLKVTLSEVRPPVWRRLQVASTINLRRLHDVIQAAMGWEQSHLYEFTVAGVSCGEPDLEFDLPTRSAKSTPLRRVAPEAGARLSYVYDFGDNWRHQVVVERVLPPEPGVTYPRCVGGRRACPPEDIGGIWGYAEFLEALRDPTHPDHEQMVTWSGGHFDPAVCDLNVINARLAHLGPSPWDLLPANWPAGVPAGVPVTHHPASPTLRDLPPCTA